MRAIAVCLVLLLSLVVMACSAPIAAQSTPPATTSSLPASELNVFAAASLTEAFREIGKAFEAANPGVKVTFNFAGSQQLVQQIGQGAPADVFASAATKNMDDAVKAGNVVDGAARTFARNRLVAIVPQANPAGIKTLADLGKPGVRLVLAAKEVPVGQYALDFLDKASKDATYGADYKDKTLKNVASYEQNVRAVLSKVTLGEADAGIVYNTDVTQDAAPKVTRIEIPDALNTVATYPIATVKGTKNPAADRFVAFVLADAGQAILKQYGFIPAH